MGLSPVIGGAGFYNKSSASPPGGANTQIQFNNAGVFGGSGALTWTAATSLLTSGRLALTGAANSRLLDISGYSLTGSDTTSMVNLAGTLNTTGVVNAIYANITNTASGAGSRAFRVDVSGSPVLSAGVDGAVYFSGNEHSLGSFGTQQFGMYVSNTLAIVIGKQGLADISLWGGAGINFRPSGNAYLLHDGADDTLAMQRGANAQTFRTYGTFTDASNYVRASLGATSTLVTLAAQTAGTGADNVDINITTAGAGLVNLANQAATVDVSVVSTHTVRMKVGGTEYKFLIATP